MNLYYMIIGGSVLFLIIIISIVVSHKKFKFNIVKFEEAEQNIEESLNKKLEILKKIQPIIKNELKREKYLEEINEDISDIDDYELHDRLFGFCSKIFKTLNENEQLFKNKELVNILNELDDNEDNLIGSIKYYNDVVIKYNKQISSVPSCIYRLFFGYKKKKCFSHEKREMFEMLNDD